MRRTGSRPGSPVRAAGAKTLADQASSASADTQHLRTAKAWLESAAAQAAQGDYPQAVVSEREAISDAKDLHRDLSPLERRLASYQAGKPWYGSLLAF